MIEFRIFRDRDGDVRAVVTEAEISQEPCVASRQKNIKIPFKTREVHEMLQKLAVIYCGD